MNWANGRTIRRATGWQAIVTHSGESIRTRKDYAREFWAKSKAKGMAGKLGWSISWGPA